MPPITTIGEVWNAGSVGLVPVPKGEWRRCSKCRQIKLAADFPGTSRYCKVPCYRDWRKKHDANRKNVVKVRSDEWMAKHDVKVCKVCDRTGAESPFKTLNFGRCIDCMSKNLFRCTVCGKRRRRAKMKGARCYACCYKREKQLAAEAHEARLNKQIFVFTGEGLCVFCGWQAHRDPAGNMQRKHVCGQSE